MSIYSSTWSVDADDELRYYLTSLIERTEAP